MTCIIILKAEQMTIVYAQWDRWTLYEVKKIICFYRIPVSLSSGLLMQLVKKSKHTYIELILMFSQFRFLTMQQLIIINV